MCGIALTWDGMDRCFEMLKSMKHRGLPGDEYSAAQHIGKVTLGHVRLPIIDTTASQNQPMSNGKISLAFNGEIYNYKELVPEASNDTEALLKMITDDGPNAFEYVDGMYACIWYDHRTNVIHVVTDYLSKKPLFISRRTFEIASEIKALKPSTRLNKHFLASVAHWGYNPNNMTVFEDVIQVPPNAHIQIDATNRSIIGWHDRLLNMTPIDVPVQDKIVQAVKNRLVSDVPISFLLSGGLDSSIVCEIASWFIPKEMNTFYVDNEEADYSTIMAGHVNSNHVALNIEGEYDLEEVLYYNESPVDLGSVVPQYILCRAVKQAGYKVVITGDGADELFGGYTRMSKYIHPAADTQYHDTFLELPYYHSLRLDKMSMAHTIELRSPFLSRDVIRAALAIPYERRIGKAVLKDLFKNDLPTEIIGRTKQPLRIADMKVDREKFKFQRIEQFINIINKGVYSNEHQ